MRHRKLILPFIQVLLILVVVVGCGGPAATSTALPTDTPVPTSAPNPTAQRVTSQKVPHADLKALTEGNNAFAFDLYQALRDAEDNLVFSPYSISQALAMTYAGARGQTAQQMADTLRFTLDQDRLHPAFNVLDLELASRGHITVQDVSSGKKIEQPAFQLNIANALWGRQGYPFLPAFLQLLAQNYGAGVQLIDFREPEAASEKINGWVSEQTNGRIPAIISPAGISPEQTALILTNAIYFNAAWEHAFDKAKDEPFYLLDGSELQAPLMERRSRFSYTEGDGYQMVEVPYGGKQIAMVIVLPVADRFREFEEWLTSARVHDAVSSLRQHRVILTMPKFEFETPNINLKGTLSSLGMVDAFEAGADFSGMDGTRELCIGNVLHKAFISVDERKTEAAAVTAVEMELVAEPLEPTPTPEWIIMRVDRPFIFFIRDRMSGTILFLGRVMNPNL